MGRLKRRVQTDCEVCGKSKEYTVSEFNKHKHHYCSLECSTKAKTGRAFTPYRDAICVTCGIKYKAKNTTGNHCSEKCRDQDWVLKNKTKVLNYKRKQYRKQKIGKLIKAEVFKEPVYGTKWLWNGEGPWSKSYMFCQECGLTVYRHHSHGLCIKCYKQDIYKANAADPETYQRMREVNEGIRQVKQPERTAKNREARDYVEKAKNGEIEVTPIIQNLINNSDL